MCSSNVLLRVVFFLKVIAMLYLILRDPKIWPEPDVLRPERFLDAEGKCIKHEQWIPFGMGRSFIFVALWQKLKNIISSQFNSEF